MKKVLDAIRHYAQTSPAAVALEGEKIHLSYRALLAEIDTLSHYFSQKGYRSVGLLMDNSPAWVVVDLAALAAGVTLIPIPAFFSREQCRHLTADAAVQAVICGRSEQASEQFSGTRLSPLPRIAGQSAWLATLTQTAATTALSGVAKVTYTSGTTAAPKGVCLNSTAMDGVAQSLSQAINVGPTDRHLNLLPLAVLLENIGGIYTPLLGGARCITPSLAKVGMLGAAKLDALRMYDAIVQYQATSIILLPEMLHALVALVADGLEKPKTLRFIAVGGAPVSERLLREAEALGLPVYQGYGLSECASVVAVNSASHQRVGSVGRLLPHIEMRFAEDGEILLRGALFSRYLNHEKILTDNGWYASGDLGYCDDDGYLYLTGRKKSCFITSFGRNVAPEWVERELTHSPLIAQAAIFGEAHPFNIAIIAPQKGATPENIASAIAKTNRDLPDYARVGAWLQADEPFSVANQLYTATARPRREAIYHHYRDRLESLFATEPNQPL